MAPALRTLISAASTLETDMASTINVTASSLLICVLLMGSARPTTGALSLPALRVRRRRRRAGRERADVGLAEDARFLAGQRADLHPSIARGGEQPAFAIPVGPLHVGKHGDPRVLDQLVDDVLRFAFAERREVAAYPEARLVLRRALLHDDGGGAGHVPHVARLARRRLRGLDPAAAALDGERDGPRQRQTELLATRRRVTFRRLTDLPDAAIVDKVRAAGPRPARPPCGERGEPGQPRQRNVRGAGLPRAPALHCEVAEPAAVG